MKTPRTPFRVEKFGNGWGVFAGILPVGGWPEKKDAKIQVGLMDHAFRIWLDDNNLEIIERRKP